MLLCSRAGWHSNHPPGGKPRHTDDAETLSSTSLPLGLGPSVGFRGADYGSELARAWNKLAPVCITCISSQRDARARWQQQTGTRESACCRAYGNVSKRMSQDGIVYHSAFRIGDVLHRTPPLAKTFKPSGGGAGMAYRTIFSLGPVRRQGCVGWAKT